MNRRNFVRCQAILFRCALMVAAVYPACLIGCGQNGRGTVGGIVTFDGEPIKSGSIVFELADKKGAAAGGKIENGKYQLAGEGKVEPGEKIVRITAVRETGRQLPGGDPGDEGVMVDELELFVPEMYNEQSILRCEVTPGPNRHNFELVSP